MKLTIIGTGYVGLESGTCFAEVGHEVVCVDNDAAKVKMLQGGGIPIYEPGLQELVQKNVAAKRLSFTNNTAEGVEKSDVIFIAVPTPPQPDGSVDLSYIEKVARDIAAAITSYKIVVDKSTVPVKTGEKVAWRSSGGGSDGRVERKLTSPGTIKGHEIAASESNPEFMVRSDKSGKVAAHKPSALKRVK